MNNTDQYTQESLTHYLEAINEKLKNRPDAAINFSANNHSVAVRIVGNQQFELVNTNNLDERNQRFTASELAKKLDNAFSNNSWTNWFTGKKPLVMNTAIFTNSNASIDLSALVGQGALTALGTGKNGATLLYEAIKSNDLAALKRIDFSQIDINQPDHLGGNALMLAIHLSDNNIIEYLLEQPKLDLNQLQKIYCI